MKVHKIEMIVCDPNNDDLSLEDLKTELENSCDDWIIHYIKTKTKNAPEWIDDSPFNYDAKKAENAFNKLK